MRAVRLKVHDPKPALICVRVMGERQGVLVSQETKRRLWQEPIWPDVNGRRDVDPRAYARVLCATDDPAFCSFVVTSMPKS